MVRVARSFWAASCAVVLLFQPFSTAATDPAVVGAGRPPCTERWEVAELSQARTWLSATSVGTKAFFVGGIGSRFFSDVVDVYDALAGEWTTAHLSVARYGIGATGVGTLAMFAGGVGGVFGDVGAQEIVDIYDDARGEWSNASLSVGRYGLAATSVGQEALFAGGNTDENQSLDVVDIYDAGTGEWRTATLSVARFRVRIADSRTRRTA